MKTNYRLLSIPFIIIAALVLMGCEPEPVNSIQSVQETPLLSNVSNTVPQVSFISESYNNLTITFPDGKKVIVNAATNLVVSHYEILKEDGGNKLTVTIK